jgi:hypothetical protein
MFSAYIQEVNFKKVYNLQFNLLTFLFRTRYDICTGNFSFNIYRVVPWHGSVRNIMLLNTHTHTHTPYFLRTSPTTFSSHHSPFTRQIFVTSLSRTETDRPLLSVVPVYRLAPSFPVYLSRGGIESLYMIFP